MTIVERLWDRATRDEQGCLIWQGCIVGRYGAIGWNKKLWRTHRVAWALTHGPIPPGMLVCHHCDKPLCIEPTHLFLGSHQDNMDDRGRKGRTRNQNAGKTHCPHGHPYSTENTWIGGRGQRQCRTCGTQKSRVWKAAHREQIREQARACWRRHRQKEEG